MLLVGRLDHRLDVGQPCDRLNAGIELPCEYATLTLGCGTGSGNLGRFSRALPALLWRQVVNLFVALAHSLRRGAYAHVSSLHLMD